MSAHTVTRSSSTMGRFSHLARRTAMAVALAGVVLGGSAGVASADDNMDTTANVVVESGITLTALTPNFTLTGIPGATVNTTASPVTYNVETNNPTGYTVTVQSATATMTPLGASADPIPIADLTVRETGAGAYDPVTAVGGTAVLVHTQAGRSITGGDTLSTDFQMRIPTVAVDQYVATLNYIAVPAA